MLLLFFFNTESNRPVFVPTSTTTANQETEQSSLALLESDASLDQFTSNNVSYAAVESEYRAPRDENGELIVRRCEVNAGRSMNVASIVWSVAQKIGTPTSELERYVWEKDLEIDNFRERIPLSNWMSQVRWSEADPSKPKPRDWIAAVKSAADQNGFVIIPECKQREPLEGCLRKRYNVEELAREFALAKVPAMSVNCDNVRFGGSLDHIRLARETSVMVSNESAPPILASDLILYPYQLFKLRLMGADAVSFLCAALEEKDLVYLTKIAASLRLKTLVTVTSAKHVKRLEKGLADGKGIQVDGLIVSNRNLEDFSVDVTGQQALDILESEELKSYIEKRGGRDVLLVEGRVGLTKCERGSTVRYMKSLQEAGATGAIVGSALVPNNDRRNPLEFLTSLWR